MEKYTIAPATHVGHANLKVADLGRALSFYRDVLGFQVRATPRGGEMVVLGASGSSLDLALMALPGGFPPPANCTGSIISLFAIRVVESWHVPAGASKSAGSP